MPDAVKADPRLNAAQRRALLAVYQAFVEAPAAAPPGRARVTDRRSVY